MVSSFLCKRPATSCGCQERSAAAADVTSGLRSLSRLLVMEDLALSAFWTAHFDEFRRRTYRDKPFLRVKGVLIASPNQAAGLTLMVTGEACSVLSVQHGLVPSQDESLRGEI
jgi:hypothetical protein